MIMKCLSVLLALFMICNEVKATILLEPYLGMAIGLGEQEIKFNDGSSTGTMDLEHTNIVIGGRIGAQMLGFMGGIDYNFASFEMESLATSVMTVNSNLITTEKYDVKKNMLGIFVGHNLPIFLRAWGTYYFSSSIEVDKTSTPNAMFAKGDKYGGDGFGLGVGFTGLPFVSVNIEYKSISYDQESGDNFSTANGLKGNIQDDTLFISVSLPLNI